MALTYTFKNQTLLCYLLPHTSTHLRWHNPQMHRINKYGCGYNTVTKCTCDRAIMFAFFAALVNLYETVTLLHYKRSLAAKKKANFVACEQYEPRHELSNNVVCATSKGSDQSAHTRSLIKAFACRLNIL